MAGVRAVLADLAGAPFMAPDAGRLRELGPRHVTVNAVAPGPFESKMMAATLAAAGDQIAAASPLGRIGRPGFSLTRRVVSSQADAERLGLTGSPTLLADGRDPFTRSGPPASVCCRLYPDDQGGLAPAPSLAGLRAALGL